MYVCEVWIVELCLWIVYAFVARKLVCGGHHRCQCCACIHGFSVNLKFVECRLVSAKFRVFFVKFLSIGCMLILLKFRGLFGFAKVRVFFS